MSYIARTLLLGVTVLVVWSAYRVHHSLNSTPPVPNLSRDQWWGPGEARQLDNGLRPFSISAPPEDIVDLHSSLDRFLKRRQTPPLETQGFQYGFNSDYLKEIITYWRNKYNWKARETYLNQYPQYKTYIQGLDIHFIRVTPKPAAGKKVLPLLLLHGWPGSVREFYDLIPLLTTPRDSADFVFEVIVPSLPGYGFSQGAAKPGLGLQQIAVIMKNLMSRLGFEKFYAHGGDWGAGAIAQLSFLYPESLLGLHINSCGSMSPTANLKLLLGTYFPSFVVEEKFQHLMYPLKDKLSFLMTESGYMHLQATKPDTIGLALGDTPAGLAAYILEKYSTWTNRDWRNLSDGGLTKKFKIDALLDIIMIYHLSGSIMTSQRLYAEAFSSLDIPVTQPSACSRFHKDIMWSSESIIRESFHNLVQLTDHEEGGHFPALEEPTLVSNDIWSAVAKFQQLKTIKN